MLDIHFNWYFVVFPALSLITAIGAFNLATAKGRNANRWAMLCFSFPPILFFLVIFGNENGTDGRWNVTVPIALVATCISSLLGAAVHFGADQMLVRTGGFPSCASNEAHEKITEFTAKRSELKSVIVGVDSEKQISTDGNQRTCEADTVDISKTQHHIRYRFVKSDKDDVTLASVIVIR
jgi:hypothetical protein